MPIRAVVPKQHGAVAGSATPLPLDGSIYRWVCLGLLIAGILLAFLVRLAPAVALPDLRSTFALSLAQAGLVTSLFMWPFAVMQPVAGLIADRFGTRATVTTFLAIAAVGQLTLALAPGSGLALVGRFLTGVGFATLFVAGAIVMTRWFQPRAFSLLAGAWTSIANIGSVAAAGPLAMLIGMIGWRSSFGLIGLAIALLAILVLAFLRDRPASPAQAAAAGGPAASGAAGPGRATLRHILRNRTLWLLSGYGFTLFGTMTMMQGFFAVPYLTDVYGLPLPDMADTLTLWAFGLIVGCTLWGWAASRTVRSPKPLVVCGAVVYGALWLVLAVWPEGLPLWMVRVAMFWGGFFVATWIPCYGMLRDAIPPEITGTAMGILNMCLWLGGAFYQQVSALILDAYAPAGAVPPLLAYEVVIWISLASVIVSVALVAAVPQARHRSVRSHA